MKIVGIIQARVGSSRLPGKVLRPAAGLPLIAHMLRRVKRAHSLNALWLATSMNSENDPLASLAAEEGVPVFRGSEDDVLSRYWTIAQKEKADWIVRLTGDCPIHDPAIIDEIVRFTLANATRYDYVSNVLLPTYPDGLDAEVFTAASLGDAYQNAATPLAREHVTPYIHRFHDGPGAYRVGHYKGPTDFSFLRWTVDEAADYEFIKIVIEALYPVNKNFGWLDVVAYLLKDPSLLELNKNIVRNEGYLKALQKLKQPV